MLDVAAMQTQLLNNTLDPEPIVQGLNKIAVQESSRAIFISSPFLLRLSGCYQPGQKQCRS